MNDVCAAGTMSHCCFLCFPGTVEVHPRVCLSMCFRFLEVGLLCVVTKEILLPLKIEST